jgi:hypothetical protein
MQLIKIKNQSNTQKIKNKSILEFMVFSKKNQMYIAILISMCTLFMMFFGQGTVKASVNTNKLIIVGDSRTNNMKKWVTDTSIDTRFIAKVGQGYNWFVNTAIEETNNMLNPGDTIIVWLGVNDYYKSNLGDNPWRIYAKKLNELVNNDWKDCNVYVASVGYVDRNLMKLYYKKDNGSNINQLNHGIRIKGIQAFNEKLRQSLDYSITWIDTFDVIGINEDDNGTDESIWVTRTNGKIDGLHYGVAKTQEIYEYFVSQVGIYPSIIN